MKVLLTVAMVVFSTAAVHAQPALTEPLEFPSSMPGPGATHPGDGCFLLASGTIVPGDVDWVQVSIPTPSTQTIVDVDFPETVGSSSALYASIGSTSASNIDDGNSAADDVCGLGGSTTPLGSPQDSVVDLGATPAGAVINIAITGGEDFYFTGNHDRNFDYDVWVYVARGPCTSDAECDDGLFCNGAETCVDGVCQPGVDPCPDQDCDEENDECIGGVEVVSLDIKPGTCPNRVNLKGHGLVPVALVGTSDFDAMDVDLASVLLFRADGLGGSVAPHEGPPGPQSVFDDVATPFPGEPCECHDLGADGIVDLLMRFKTDALVETLGLGALPSGEVVELVVSGTLLDGTPFTATDCVEIQNRVRRGTDFSAAGGDTASQENTAFEASDVSAADDDGSGSAGAESRGAGRTGCGAVGPATLLLTVGILSLVVLRRQVVRL
ncbi:MAG: hypothetical protein JSV19_13045 [Phycisphaerales bacterium]|nr:MAG: hypothetical protein JSV19_13045 [Phycisphaerales bacterium]